MTQSLVHQSNTDLDQQIDRLKQLVVDSVTSPESKRSYGRSVDEFMRWHVRELPGQGFTKSAVNAYKAYLLKSGLGAGSINVRLSAVRRLAAEAGDNGMLDPNLAAAVGRVKGVRNQGTKLGHWLTLDQARQLLDLPNLSTLGGKRDRALLALMVGSGLRREEVASICMTHIQMREARWLLVDVVGKGRKTRSIPIPAMAKAAIDVWTEAAGIVEGRVFRPVNKGDRITGIGITAQAVFDTVKKYAKKMGLELAPHDLRRSFAKLAHRGHASIDQISLSLGHSDIKTTQLYLGIEQDLTDAPCDHLGI